MSISKTNDERIAVDVDLVPRPFPIIAPPPFYTPNMDLYLDASLSTSSSMPSMYDHAPSFLNTGNFSWVIVIEVARHTLISINRCHPSMTHRLCSISGMLTL